MKSGIHDRLTALLEKPISQSDDAELYAALAKLVREESLSRVRPVTGRKLYYISAEFLTGRLLINNLINLGLYDEARTCLQANGRSLAAIEALEPEPALGNGGLGRLAACFLDSLAALDLPGDGIGLRYRCGLFRQRFVNARQNETPDRWIGDDCQAMPAGKTYPVSMAGRTFNAVLYRIPVTGCGGRTNALNLFDLDTVDESILSGGIAFDKSRIDKNLTLFLYPDDSDEAGRELRLYQQYLMVSAGAQLILEECARQGSNWHDLADHAAIQINDTHPSLVIPELIRLLGDRGIGFDEAAGIVTDVCAYTNHTVLAEALETWHESVLERVVPQLMPVMRDLNALACSRGGGENTAIIDASGTAHMARMDIHFSHSVNGVADMHTRILKEDTLRDLHALYPEKFNNKTNGISFRRWLFKCNPCLTEEIEARIGPGFRKDASELEKLLGLADDIPFLARFAAIKLENKASLCEWLHETQGAVLNPISMFSVQAKRLHEYKRQQLNLLFLIHQYLEIRSGRKPAVPLTAIFGAKAAPAYTLAKDIIHALLTLSRVIDEDPAVSRWLRVVFVENYNVTAAEKMIPACDLSEQISLAGKEASGTGNMKFMLNGAVTLGTMDGANAEIAGLVGGENIYIFGRSADQVRQTEENGSHRPREWYESDPNLKRCIDFLTGGEMRRFGNDECLARLQNELICNDRFQTLPDFNAYIVRKGQAMADYAGDPIGWLRKCLVNTAKAGYFSADRTIAEYNRDIWKL